ncbi:hypothetical protein Tco_0695669 [Tanacetum coccineum]
MSMPGTLLSTAVSKPRPSNFQMASAKIPLQSPFLHGLVPQGQRRQLMTTQTPSPLPKTKLFLPAENQDSVKTRDGISLCSPLLEEILQSSRRSCLRTPTMIQAPHASFQEGAVIILICTRQEESLKLSGYGGDQEGMKISNCLISAARDCHKVVRLGINPMIQPEPEDLPKDNPKLEIAVLRSVINELTSGEIVSLNFIESIKEARSQCSRPHFVEIVKPQFITSNKEARSLYDCMTRSSTNKLFTPYKEPKREFRSSRRHFKTLSLDELRSHDFNLLSDQEYSEEEVAETMAETMEQYMSKTRADY